MKRLWVFVLVLWAALIPQVSGAQTKEVSVAGDWQGVLQAGPVTLHLRLHLKEAADGALSGTLDSVDQGANGIAISKAEWEGDHLQLTWDLIHGSYEAKLSKDGATLSGTWTQGMSAALKMTRMNAEAAKAAVAAGPLDGAWSGVLDFSAMKLHLVAHLTTTADGLKAMLDSPDQGAFGIPATSAELKDGALTVKMEALGAEFACKPAAGAEVLHCTFQQRGTTLPLELTRVKDTAAMHELPKRPQTPVKPYPYREVEANFASKAAGVTLAGTLTLPEGKGPFAAVVLVAGSGPNGRDEEVFGHKIFLVLADQLTRKGIAVLRYDKRGVGQSQGDYAKSTTADFADDAESALEYLKARPEVDARHVGMLGHSEGGEIAPMVAARNADVKFAVLLAGPGVPGKVLLPEQIRLVSVANGMKAEAAAKMSAGQAELYALAASGADAAALAKRVREQLEAEGRKITDAEIDATVKQLDSPWFRYLMKHDPAEDLRKVSCPVLALNGEKDLQVPAAQNLPAIRTALAGNKQARVEQVPGVNHLFQTAKTGSPVEYGQIEETMSPVVLEEVSSWISQQSKTDAAALR